MIVAAITVPGSASTNPAWNGNTYPGDFGKDLGGDFPKNVWELDPAILQAWGNEHSNRSAERIYYPDMFNLKEKTKAAYVATELEGAGWSGNAGVRVVRTEGESNGYQILPNQLPGGNLPAFPWGGFVQQTRIENNHTEILPSLNLRFDVRSDVVARFGASRTMTRPDFGALGGTVSLTDETHTGNGGNAALKPTLSNNLDATVQWYFAPRALASVGLFYMDLHNYVGYGSSTGTFIDSRASQQSGQPTFATYTITSPVNVDASVKGIELALQMPQYGDRLSGLVAQVSAQLAKHGIDAGSYLEGALRGPEIGRAVLSASGAIASGLSNLALTFFIFAFMLGGMWELERRASTRSRDHSPLAARFLAFSETIRGYMGVRAVLGLIAAVLDYILLEAMGVDYALLWGVLSFLLSFVPNIGFTLSLVPPTLLALVEKGWVPAVIVLVGYQVINNVIDNVIGPKFVGREMKISALLSFLSVIFWAWVLGATGAILAVPLTVLIRDLAFGPSHPPDIGRPQPVTSSTMPISRSCRSAARRSRPSASRTVKSCTAAGGPLQPSARAG